MAGRSSLGLIVANNLLANRVLLNLEQNQASLRHASAALSSGLRITSAADDPSGYALATKLAVAVSGYTQASSNVQEASHAVAAADGAFAAATSILQRIRNLAVEAATDVSTDRDRAAIQTEIAQLIFELNRISQTTSFNGAHLLDGSHAGFQPQHDAYVTVTANAALATNGNAPVISAVNAGYLIATVAAANAFFNTTVGSASPAPSNLQNGQFNAQALPANGIDGVNAPVPAGWTALGGGVALFNGGGGIPALPAGEQGVVLQAPGGGLQQTLTGLTPGTTYDVTFQAATSGGKGAGTLLVQVNGATILNVNPPLPVYQTYTTSFVAPGSGTVTFAIVDSSPENIAVANVQVAPVSSTLDGTIEVEVVNTGVSVAAQETFIQSATGAISVSSTLYAPDTVTTDFDNVAVTLGDFTIGDVGVTAYVKVSQNVAALTNPDNPAFNIHSGNDEGDALQVGLEAIDARTLRVSNINVLLTSPNTSPSIGAEDAIGQIDIALKNLLNERAQLGALLVRLQQDADDDSLAATNLQSAESNIRDLNVGEAVTEFTKKQLLVEVGSSLLLQTRVDAREVLRLF